MTFFVVCQNVLPFVTKMTIDEKKEFVLTNYQQVRKGGNATDTDHATQIIDLNLEMKKQKPDRNEMFNFKESEAHQIC